MKEKMKFDAADIPGVAAFHATTGLGMREDDSAFTASQLNFVRTRVYEANLPRLTGLQLVPIDTDVPEWAETVEDGIFDMVGMAKVIANYADDLPRADVKRTPRIVKVREIGDAYGYNVAEIRASMANGTNLPARKANAARRAIDEKMNSIAWVGDVEYGMYGLLNHPNIGTTSITGTWSGATFAAIIADLNAMYDAVRVQSSGAHMADTIVLPTAAYSRANTVVNTAGNETALSFWLRTHPGVSVFESPELTGVGTAGKDVGFAYERNVENFALEMPMPFNQLPAQARNLEIVVNCLARTAGVTVRYPLSITKSEGF